MNKLFLLVCVLFVSSFGCSKRYTEEEWVKKDLNRVINEENRDLKAERLALKLEVTNLEKEILELKLKTARQEAEISSKNAALILWERKVSNLEIREAKVDKNLGVLATKEEQVEKDKAEIAKWKKDVSGVKTALAEFTLEIENRLLNIQIMENNLKLAQEAFVAIKTAPNTMANRARMSDHVAYIEKFQRDLYIAQQDEKNRLLGDLTRVKSMIP